MKLWTVPKVVALLAGQTKSLKLTKPMLVARLAIAHSASPPRKKAVVALVTREGHTRSFHVANLNAKALRPLIVTNVDHASHLMTGESHVYTAVWREFAGHTTVIHSKNEYARKAGFAHSNTVENFFSIFKRSVIGTYHHMSEAQLGRYCKKFDFRYNTRAITDGERGALAVKGAVGKRLMYQQPRAVAV